MISYHGVKCIAISNSGQKFCSFIIVSDFSEVVNELFSVARLKLNVSSIGKGGSELAWMTSQVLQIHRPQPLVLSHRQSWCSGEVDVDVGDHRCCWLERKVDVFLPLKAPSKTCLVYVIYDDCIN